MTGTATQHNAAALAEEGRTEALGLGATENSARWAVGESLHAARAHLTQPGCYLIYEDFRGEPMVRTVERNKKIRIGRSLNADIRYEDPTISRRHALIIPQGDEVRVVDDRSLNGVFLDGERVFSSVLADGDELTVGRHRILFVRLPSS